MNRTAFIDKNSYLCYFIREVLSLSVFGDRLLQLRQGRHMSQATVSASVGIAQSTLAQWESGVREPSFAMIGKLAQYFDVSPAYFFADTENIPKLNALAEKYECLLSRPDAQAVLDYLLNQPVGDRDRILKALLSMFGVG